MQNKKETFETALGNLLSAALFHPDGAYTAEKRDAFFGENTRAPDASMEAVKEQLFKKNSGGLNLSSLTVINNDDAVYFYLTGWYYNEDGTWEKTAAVIAVYKDDRGTAVLEGDAAISTDSGRVSIISLVDPETTLADRCNNFDVTKIITTERDKRTLAPKDNMSNALAVATQWLVDTATLSTNNKEVDAAQVRYLRPYWHKIVEAYLAEAGITAFAASLELYNEQVYSIINVYPYFVGDEATAVVLSAGILYDVADGTYNVLDVAKFKEDKEVALAKTSDARNNVLNAFDRAREAGPLEKFYAESITVTGGAGFTSAEQHRVMALLANTLSDQGIDPSVITVLQDSSDMSGQAMKMEFFAEFIANAPGGAYNSGQAIEFIVNTNDVFLFLGRREAALGQMTKNFLNGVGNVATSMPNGPISLTDVGTWIGNFRDVFPRLENNQF